MNYFHIVIWLLLVDLLYQEQHVQRKYSRHHHYRLINYNKMIYYFLVYYLFVFFKKFEQKTLISTISTFLKDSLKLCI